MSVSQVSAIDPHQGMHGSEGNMKAQILWSPKTENGVASSPIATWEHVRDAELEVPLKTY